MSPSDASPSEMPGFPFPGRPGGEHDEPLLDMILGRRALPPDAPPEIHDLARMLAALSGPAEPGELAAEADVLAAFTRLGRLGAARPPGRSHVPAHVLRPVRSSRVSPPVRSSVPGLVSPPVRRPTRHRRRRARGSVRPRVGLATALVGVLAGLVILVTYAGDLPGPVQRLAHTTVAAPAPASAHPQVTTTLDNRQGVRRTQQATPDHHTTAPATGSTSKPRRSPEASSSHAHPGMEGCNNEQWWRDPAGSPGRGYHRPPPWAQPKQCPAPDPYSYPSTPALGSDH